MTINWLKQFGAEPLVMCNTAETMSAVDAARDAAAIVRYWRDKGFDNVKAKAVPRARNVNGQVIYGVQSNLRNGRPPP